MTTTGFPGQTSVLAMTTSGADAPPVDGVLRGVSGVPPDGSTKHNHDFARQLSAIPPNIAIENGDPAEPGISADLKHPTPSIDLGTGGKAVDAEYPADARNLVHQKVQAMPNPNDGLERVQNQLAHDQETAWQAIGAVIYRLSDEAAPAGTTGADPATPPTRIAGSGREGADRTAGLDDPVPSMAAAAVSQHQAVIGAPADVRLPDISEFVKPQGDLRPMEARLVESAPREPCTTIPAQKSQPARSNSQAKPGLHVGGPLIGPAPGARDRNGPSPVPTPTNETGTSGDAKTEALLMGRQPFGATIPAGGMAHFTGAESPVADLRTNESNFNAKSVPRSVGLACLPSPILWQ